MQQDRATAIAGTLGRGPAMMPVTSRSRPTAGRVATFNFSVVNDQLFTPLLTYLSLVNTLTSYEREFGASTFTVKGAALVKEHGEIAFEDLFTGDSPSIGAASYIAGPLDVPARRTTSSRSTSTARPDDRRVREAAHGDARARVARRAVDRAPGTTVPLKVLLRTYRGEEVTQTVPIEIPANASGIADAAGRRRRAADADGNSARSRRPQQARDVAQMIQAFNKARKNNRLYVRLLSADAGAVVERRIAASLPAVGAGGARADRSGGSFSPLRTRDARRVGTPDRARRQRRPAPSTLSLDRQLMRRSACR